MPTQTSGSVTGRPLGNGQGKRAVTLLTEGGCFYPIISPYSYTDRHLRARSAPQNAGRIRGTRPMHQTTFVIAKAPWVPETSYLTSTKQNYSGSKVLNPVRRPPLCPSMHKSQIKLTHPPNETSQVGPDWNTHYTGTFMEKDIIPANRLHLTSLVNRIDQQEGADMKQTIKMENNSPNYFTQYTRIHGKLGTLLGQGLPRDYPVRMQYNILTGETVGPAWREQNKRTSGDKLMHGVRREQTTILG